MKEFNLGEELDNKYDLKTIEMLFSFIYSGQYKQFSELFKFNNVQGVNQMIKYFQQFKELADKFNLSDLKKQVIDEMLKKIKQNESMKNDSQLRQFVETNISVLCSQLTNDISIKILNYQN